MIIGAAFLMFVTVTLGAVQLGFWSDPLRRRTDQRSHVLGVIHVSLALPAVAVWVIYLIGRDQVVGVAGVGVLAAVFVLGVATFVSTSGRDRRTEVTQRADAVPGIVLALHGAAAVAALVTAAVAVA